MLYKLSEVYKGKRIFLTGHTGFKGSWLLKILSLLGAEVKGYALAPENDLNLYSIVNGDALCDSVIADLRNRETLNEAVSSFQPDFIFHLAAQPLVRLSYKIPSETFEVNAIGTANVLDAMRLLNKPCNAVLITTDKVYHNNETDYAYKETDRLGGYDPYSASKACTELVIDSYCNSFFHVDKYETHRKAIAIGRAGNVIGGGDWSQDRLIPDVVRALSAGKEIEVRNPSSVRPWQHVLEPLYGYLLLGAKLAKAPTRYSQAYNFGPNINDAFPVKQMVELAINCWGSGSYFTKAEVNQPHEAGLLKLDINKAVDELKWQPHFDATKAVQYTIDWYKNFYADRNKANAYTQGQIFAFLNSIDDQQ